ncbi:MAG: hypothetical protein ABI330_03940 [Caldimonas sp.]
MRRLPTDKSTMRSIIQAMPCLLPINAQVSGQVALHARAPFWATASISDAADTSPMELSALGAHVDRCNGSRGRMFGLHCVADAVRSFIAPRFVTTLIAVGFVFGVVSLIV